MARGLGPEFGGLGSILESAVDTSGFQYTGDKGMYNIKITEVNNSSSHIELDWLPSEIRDAGGNIIFATYTLLDRGEVTRPIGNEVRKISWDSMFPGMARAGMPILDADWMDPMEYDDKIKLWKSDRKLLCLTITGTNISQFKCYVETYESSHSGGFGDLYYSISLVEYERINVETVPKTSKKTPVKNNPKRPASSSKTYKVVSGDSLSKIAAKKLGKASRWKEIYNLNSKTIEDVAKKKGFKSSNNGNRIWPGTVLKLPSR